VAIRLNVAQRACPSARRHSPDARGAGARAQYGLETGASINGRLLAQTAVTLDGSAVVEPAP
jgi:hypothetical protein